MLRKYFLHLRIDKGMYYLHYINEKCFPNRIHQKAILEGNIHIGKDIIIQGGAAVGNEGLSHVKNEDGKWEYFPSIGGIEVGDRSWIGANAVVDRGTLGNTIIGADVCIAPHSHIGHNTKVGDNVFIGGHTNVGGSCNLGANSFIAIGCLVRNKVNIGENAIVGMGSIVTKDVPANTTVWGNPAKFRRNHV